MELKGRVYWIDITRGIAIILVIILHSCTSRIRDYNYIAYLMYMFTVTSAVPVLFFISGYSMKLSREKYGSKHLWLFIKEKASKLLIPYCAYATSVYLIFKVAEKIPVISEYIIKIGYGNMSALSFLIGLLIGNNVFSIHLWFLYTLFFFEIFTYAVWRYKKNHIAFWIVSFFLYGLSFFLDDSFSIAWRGCCGNYIFFVMGIYLNKSIAKKKIILLTGLWMFFYLEYIIFNYWSYEEKHISRLIIPFLAVMVIPAMGMKIKNSIGDVLQWVGQKSMTLYLFQQPFFGSALGTVLFNALGVPALFSIILSMFFSIIMPLSIRQIFVKYRWFRFLFGVK